MIDSEKERIIKIINAGDIAEKIEVKQSNLVYIAELSETSFSLEPGESKEIRVNLKAPHEAGIYTGKILIAGKEILVSMNIRSGALLFDAGIVVPDAYKTISPGDRIKTQVNLIPMGENPRLDVTLNYIIKDFDGKVHTQESETILIDKQKSFEKEFSSVNLEPGDYVIGLELIYPNGVATSSSHFKIEEKSLFNLQNILILAGIVLAIGIILLMIKYKKHKKLAIKTKKRK
jgi:uncharacterized membrane protein